MNPEIPTTVDDVRSAMHRGELFVEYQPIVSLATRCCVGAEALVRWWRNGTVLPASEIAPRYQ